MSNKAKSLSEEQAKSTPLYIRDVITNHLCQTVGAMLATIPKGQNGVFYMGISGVEAKNEIVSSDGVGTLAGPLKASTKQEKDNLVATLSGMPSSFRSQLDKNVEVLIATTVAGNELGHQVIIELTKKELLALNA
jgi:hypothetical protein